LQSTALAKSVEKMALDFADSQKTVFFGVRQSDESSLPTSFSRLNPSKRAAFRVLQENFP